MLNLIEKLNKTMRDVLDFPSKGIIFKDITPILADINLYNEIIEVLASQYKNKNISKVVGLESRGFIFGISIAQKLGLPFIPIRKKGKLPYKTISTDYQLEYGTASIEIHTDAINEGENILIVDDLLATGGTASAAVELVKKLKGNVIACVFLTELLFLNGKSKLKDIEVFSILKY
ncbi:adenine phosphoribosyltransferase [Elusimicrobiota bacterium]